MGSISKSREKKNQRQQKCYPLEPVDELCVAHHDEARPPPPPPPHHGTLLDQKRLHRRRLCVLVRLRDWYVRVMNDMAAGADLSGVSAMYGCSSGQVDYPGVTAMVFAKRAQEEEEMAENLQVDAALRSCNTNVICKSDSSQN